MSSRKDSGPPDHPAGRKHDLAPVGVRLGLADLEMPGTLIIGGARKPSAGPWPASASKRAS